MEAENISTPAAGGSGGLGDEYLYDAFFSYASSPDRDLVREVENFLEGLHVDPLIAPKHRRELQICVDGSDFKKPRRQADTGSGAPDVVFSLITQYMARSRCLVVFSGPLTKDHDWLNKELAWWLANRGARDVHIVLSHGLNAAPGDWMPDPAIKAGFFHEIWFDFRSAKKARVNSTSNRDYAEERLRLAAALIGNELAAADLIKGWRVLQDAAAKRRKRRLALVLALTGSLAIGLGFATVMALERATEARVGLWAMLANAGSSQDPDRRLDALAYGAASLHALPTADAFRATAESLQILARPIDSIQVDHNKRALDTVAYLGNDRWLAVAGYDATLRLYERQGLKLVAAIKLQGRAVSLVDRPGKSELVIVTRQGIDIAAYELSATPKLTLRGRLAVEPVRVEGSINRGTTLAAALDAQRGVLYASACWRRPNTDPSGMRTFSWTGLHR